MTEPGDDTARSAAGGHPPMEPWEERLHAHIDRTRDTLRFDVNQMSSHISTIVGRLDEHSKWIGEHKTEAAVVNERLFGEEGVAPRLRTIEESVEAIRGKTDAARWWVVGAGAVVATAWTLLAVWGEKVGAWLAGKR